MSVLPLRCVLFITERYPPQPGGAAVSARRIASAIQASGAFRLTVLHPAADLPPGQRVMVEEDGLPVCRLGPPGDTEESLRASLHAVEDLAARQPFAILHGFYLLHAGYLAAFAARHLGAASVVSARGNDVDRAMLRPEQFPFLRWTLEHADAVTCVSEELRDKCLALADVPPGRIVAIPNSVDSDFFRPMPRDQELLEKVGWRGEVLLGFFSELRSKKGPHTLLRAVAAAQRERPCRLLLVGGPRQRPADREHWKQLRQAFPLLERSIAEIEYVEDRQQMRAYYNLVDVALFPSLYDGMPNAALEAMACARPVLANDAGGLRELVRDNETGFLASRHDPAAFPRRLLEVLRQEPGAVAAVGRQARELVRARYTPQAERDAYLRLYRQLAPADS